MQPAIELAEQGFPVHQQCAHEWGLGVEALCEAAKGLGEDTYPFLVDGKGPQPGQIFSNPALGATFRKIAEQGKEGFYYGGVAQAIVDSMSAPRPRPKYLDDLVLILMAGIQSRGGYMTLDDLADHRSEFVDPLSYTYGEEQHTVWECPPNGLVPLKMNTDCQKRN